MTVPPVEARRTTPRKPGGTKGDPDFEADLRFFSARRLRCRSCRHVVASDDDRIEVEGRHVHRRINPAGIDFEFGCFDAGVAVTVVGESTSEFSWFSGYTWAFSICSSCGSHLGWFFEGQDPRFHGLILNALKIEEGSV